MNPKKITIATGIYPPDSGGPATYSRILFEELPKHGIEVNVVSYGEVRNYPKFISHVVYIFKLINRSKNSDIIFAQDPVSVGLPALFVSKILGKKFLLKVVGDYAWEQGVSRYGVKDDIETFSSTQSGYGLYVSIMKFVEKKVATEADGILVPSGYLKKIVSNWGISTDKISVVYNSFDGEIENIGVKEKSEEKIIVSTSRLVPWKGFLTLIAIMPKLIKHFPNIKLIIIGDGPDEKVLKSSISDLGLESHIFMTGRLSRDKVLKYIRGADVFVLNTSYEGLSHLLLEAMSLWTPIVTTNVGGNPELITNGESGILVPYDDREKLQAGIEKVLVDDEFSEKITRGAIGKLKDFSLEKMLSGTINFLSI